MQTMQMVPPDDQIINQTKLFHLLAKYATTASGAIWWPNLQLMQVAPSGGQIFNNCKWRHLVVKIATNASGPIWWPNLITESISGSVVPLAMFKTMYILKYGFLHLYFDFYMLLSIFIMNYEFHTNIVSSAQCKLTLPLPPWTCSPATSPTRTRPSVSTR